MDSMPWWGALIVFCVSIVALFILGQILANVTFNDDIRERMHSDRPVCCSYWVFAAEEHKELFFGIKYRTVKGLPQVSEYKRFFRKIYVFKQTMQICGVECEVIYYVGEEPEKREDVYITSDGRKLLESFTGYDEIFKERT